MFPRTHNEDMTKTPEPQTRQEWARYNVCHEDMAYRGTECVCGFHADPDELLFEDFCAVHHYQTDNPYARDIFNEWLRHHEEA